MLNQDTGQGKHMEGNINGHKIKALKIGPENSYVKIQLAGIDHFLINRELLDRGLRLIFKLVKTLKTSQATAQILQCLEAACVIVMRP